MDTTSTHKSASPFGNTNNPDNLPDDTLVELYIVLDDTELWVRGFANYLELIDGFYGRADPRGYRSYAHRPEDQVEIAEVRRGSLELIISELIAHTDTVAPVFILYLLLKYLPDFLKSIVSIYKNFEEAKYLKARRENLQKQMEDDKEIKVLNQDQRQELIEILDGIYVAESDTIRKSVNFVESRFRRIKMHSTGSIHKSGTP